MALVHNIFSHLCSRRLLCPYYAAKSSSGNMHLDFVFFFCAEESGSEGVGGGSGNRIFVDLIFSLPRFFFFGAVKTPIFLRCLQTFEAFVRFLRCLEFKKRRIE